MSAWSRQAGGPRIDPPQIDGALAWTIGTSRSRSAATGIGSITTDQKLFVTRFRVVARRSGMLEIPSIKVQLRRRLGPKPADARGDRARAIGGRPAEFLGGVGRFALSAEAAPSVVRVGQEMEFRIKVTGPAAWGMTDRPDLARYDQLSARASDRAQSRMK